MSKHKDTEAQRNWKMEIPKMLIRMNILGISIFQFLCASVSLCLLLLAVAPPLQAQRGQRGQQAGVPPTPRSSAAADLTGYWVSVVTEDWEFRMLTPPKGEFGGLGSIPINDEGKRVAATWDPAKDEAAGEQCRSYGAAALMRVPGRLHITWENDNTLRIDTDAGTQTRLLHFAAAGSKAPEGEPAWQGYSVVQWEGGGARGGARGGSAGVGGSLKGVTTRMRPGYLRKN